MALTHLSFHEMFRFTQITKGNHIKPQSHLKQKMWSLPFIHVSSFLAGRLTAKISNSLLLEAGPCHLQPHSQPQGGGTVVKGTSCETAVAALPQLLVKTEPSPYFFALIDEPNWENIYCDIVQLDGIGCAMSKRVESIRKQEITQ